MIIEHNYEVDTNLGITLTGRVLAQNRDLVVARVIEQWGSRVEQGLRSGKMQLTINGTPHQWRARQWR